MESHPVEYGDWIRLWLRNKGLDYDELKQKYEGAKTYFNKETYEIKKQILQDILTKEEVCLI